jgi:hypothetical protein
MQSRAVANEQMGIGERHVRVLENRMSWGRQMGIGEQSGLGVDKEGY